MNVVVVSLVVIIATIPVTAVDILEKTCSEKTVAESPTLKNVLRNRELTDSEKNVRWWYLHAIEEDLLRQQWAQQERPCLRQLLKLITNVHNSTLWATWIWDSMQFPVGQLYGSRNQLGNFDQCMNLPWKDHPEFRTQYCLAEVDLSELDSTVLPVDLLGPVEKFIRRKTKHGLKYNNMLWGICAPAICKSDSVAKFVDAMFQSTHLGLLKVERKISVNPALCQISGEIGDISTKEYLSLLSVIFLIITTFVCTYYKYNVDSPRTSSNFISVLAEAFDIKSNAHWLFKEQDQTIRSLLGVRVISNYLIVAGHFWFIKNIIGISNAGEIDKKLDHPLRNVQFNIDMVVDIFFMISGLLVTKSLLDKKTISIKPYTTISKRYIRYLCSIVAIIILKPIIMLKGDPGPLVRKYLQKDVDSCERNWWKAIVMIGNYGDTENMCYPVLWSLACDFHLFVIGVLICWIYRKNKSTGIKIYVLTFVASIVIPVIHAYINHSPSVIAFNFRATYNVRKFPIGDPAYVRTHLRAGPYFVGMAFGFLMAQFHPEKYRNVISKKSSTYALLTFLALFGFINYLSGTYHVAEYRALESAIFSVVRRSIFAGLIGFLVVICEYGTLPIVSSVLGWPGLVPFSKLAYGVYLTHFMLALRFMARTRVPLRSNIIDDMSYTMGLMVFSMILSILIWLFWEAPAVNLFDMLLKRYTRKITKQYEKVESNEIKNGNFKIISRDYEGFTSGQVEKMQKEKRFDEIRKILEKTK